METKTALYTLQAGRKGGTGCAACHADKAGQFVQTFPCGDEYYPCSEAHAPQIAALHEAECSRKNPIVQSRVQDTAERDRLQAENARMEEALERIANYEEVAGRPPSVAVLQSVASHFLRARAALAKGA